MRRELVGACAAALAAVCGSDASAQRVGVRVASWNITFFSGDSSDAADVRNVVYGLTPLGTRLDPDVFLLQEFSGQTAVNSFVSFLNADPNSGGQWAAGTLTRDDGSLNNAFAYRRDKLSLAETVELAASSSTANPRTVARYTTRIVGYPENVRNVIHFIPVHFKAGSSSDDQTRRTAEVNRVLPAIASLTAPIVFAGDFNIQSSTQAAFAALVGPVDNYNSGRFVDPINSPGTWNNSSTFRNIHTQDPATGVDDRLDVILVTQNLRDGRGSEYIGDPSRAWNLSTVADPVHSYRVWGNDGSGNGTSSPLRISGNTTVGASIAQSIVNLASGNGHMPVFLTLSVPPVVEVAGMGPGQTIDLGERPAGEPIVFTLEVGNGGDAALYGEFGVTELDFSFESADGPLTLPVGQFTDRAGGSMGVFEFTLTPGTAGEGPIGATFRIASNDELFDLNPTITVTATLVSGACNVADLSRTPPVAGEFGSLDGNDIAAFVSGFIAGEDFADLSDTPPGSGAFGTFDGNDIAAFVSAFLAGCPAS